MAWTLGVSSLITEKVELSVSDFVQTNSGANHACCLVGTRGEWSEHEADYPALFSTANKTDKLYLLCHTASPSPVLSWPPGRIDIMLEILLECVLCYTVYSI
jgi:hypothetical protein